MSSDSARQEDRRLRQESAQAASEGYLVVQQRWATDRATSPATMRLRAVRLRHTLTDTAGLKMRASPARS